MTSEEKIELLEREYKELWCAIWCCPIEEYRRAEAPSEDGGATHEETKAEAIRCAMEEAKFRKIVKEQEQRQ